MIEKTLFEIVKTILRDQEQDWNLNLSNEINMETKFQADMKLDSLDKYELLYLVEDATGFSILEDKMPECKTIGEFVIGVCALHEKHDSDKIKE